VQNASNVPAGTFFTFCIGLLRDPNGADDDHKYGEVFLPEHPDCFDETKPNLAPICPG
jgi:hypothetical protein